ncbi:hypothetical protein [Novosphingobium terrae]|uniref:hypothetical protein n=1 Tax=Novosphingobium terrae TaxID=2726189 RepID=UPI00197CF0C3|nr:hypothetical protein [Novosphingobium terrae]
MFDEIDAAYCRMRAREEREKANQTNPHIAEKYRIRADLFDKKACALMGSAAA